MTIADKILARIEERGLTEAAPSDFVDLSNGSSIATRRTAILRALIQLEREGRLPVPRKVQKPGRPMHQVPFVFGRLNR